MTSVPPVGLLKALTDVLLVGFFFISSLWIEKGSCFQYVRYCFVCLFCRLLSLLVTTRIIISIQLLGNWKKVVCFHKIRSLAQEMLIIFLTL